MSAFTEWNGPPAGRGPSTRDVLALIDAYNNLNTTLAKHLAGTWVDDVHGFRTAFKEAMDALEKSVNEAIAGKAEAEAVSELEAAVAENADAIAAEADRANETETKLAEAVSVENKRALKAELALNEAVTALEAALEETKETFSQALSRISFDDEDTTTVEGVLAATEYLVGMLKIRKLADFIEWETITARYAGTGANDSVTRTHGIYILGYLSEEWDPDKGFDGENAQKGARAYIKYVSDKPFDIIADITSSGGGNGTITCLASFGDVESDDAWEDVALHLLKNTDSSGDSHVYLGISARRLYGQSTQFHIAGVNFIAGGGVNGISTSIGAVRVKQGYNAYRANFDDLRVSSLNDVHGDSMLSVQLYGDAYGGAYKALHIAGDAYGGVYFSKRPCVLFLEELDGDTSATKIAPVLTSYDLDDLSAGGSIKGIIVFWPQWEEAVVNGVPVKRAINIPDKWIACDGSTVSTSDYPTLIEILGLSSGAATATLPRIDHAIMRLTNLFDDVELDEGSATQTAMTNLQLTGAVTQLQEDLETEAETREAADIALQANIDQEAADRAEADAALQANIDQEALDRAEADDALQSNIDQEAADRADADAALQTNIDQEAADRAEADTALSDEIAVERSERYSADNALQAQIDDLEDSKAIAWMGTQSQFDEAKDGISDGTIILSPDEIDDDDSSTGTTTEPEP